MSLASSCARVFLPLLCHKGNTSVAKQIRSFQMCFCKERKFLAKLLKMGIAWSFYKENRKEKRNLKGMLMLSLTFVKKIKTLPLMVIVKLIQGEQKILIW